MGKFQSMIICNMQNPGCTPSKQCIDIKMGISLLYDMIHTVRWCYTFWNFQATDEGTRRDYSELLKCDKKLCYSILVFWNNRTYQLHKKCYYKAVASRSCLFTFQVAYHAPDALKAIIAVAFCDDRYIGDVRFRGKLKKICKFMLCFRQQWFFIRKWPF